MNERNTIIKEILEELYCELNKEELELKKKELRTLPNNKLFKIHREEVLPLLELNELNEKCVLESFCEEYEHLKY